MSEPPAAPLPAHPVRLVSVQFPDVKFSRPQDLPAQLATLNLRFELSQTLDLDTRELESVLKVSANHPREDAGLSFSLSAAARFRCREFSDAARALTEFHEAQAALPVLLPFVREYLAELTRRAGLPALHLPLLMPRDALARSVQAEPWDDDQPAT